MRKQKPFAAAAAIFVSSFSILLVAAPAGAQTGRRPRTDAPISAGQSYYRANYTKYEYMIPMRDGVRLFTSVFVPKDDSEKYPILLTRTPYSCRPYGIENYPDLTEPMLSRAKERFIFVTQDVRGRYASEGTFVHMRPQIDHKSGPKDVDESTDAYDTIDWLVKNIPNNNGNVGMTGISYPGFYTAAGMIDSHPALKCASPQAPITDWFIGDDFHHNGALYLPASFGFLATFGQKLQDPVRQRPIPFDYKTPDGYEFYLNMGPLSNADKLYFHNKIAFWDDLMDHGTYDAYWQSRNLRPHLKNVKTAIMTVGGWFDAEDLFGTLAVYRSVEKQDPGTFNTLVMGPWFHGGWSRGEGDHLGNVRFFSNTSEFYRDNIELPFFKHFLKGDSKLDLPKAYVFETGTDQWRRYDAWPPKNAHPRALYLHSAGRLSFDPPLHESGDFDEYVSDPAKPVPYIPNVAIDMTREHMTDDQRFASTRTDVLMYQTPELEDDVTIAGPIRSHLEVSTSGTDSDWVVKLIDVYPGDYPNPNPNPAGVQLGGYQQLVRGDIFRGKFRNSFEHPEPFEPGKLTKIEFVMPDVCHTFRRGHRIMVQVQSSWFPLVDRNPQTFCDIHRAGSGDFHKAVERVYRSAEQKSWVEVDVLSRP